MSGDPRQILRYLPGTTGLLVPFPKNILVLFSHWTLRLRPDSDAERVPMFFIGMSRSPAVRDAVKRHTVRAPLSVTVASEYNIYYWKRHQVSEIIADLWPPPEELQSLSYAWSRWPLKIVSYRLGYRGIWSLENIKRTGSRPYVAIGVRIGLCIKT